MSAQLYFRELVLFFPAFFSDNRVRYSIVCDIFVSSYKALIRDETFKKDILVAIFISSAQRIPVFF